MASDPGTDNVVSLLTGGRATRACSLPVGHITALYQKEYGVDVARFLPVESVGFYRCEDTGYEFFTPLSLAGPPDFYAALYGAEDHGGWAYQDVKWDYAAAAEHVPRGARLLDIGSGGGEFLKYIADRCVAATGLESNPIGVESAGAKGVRVVEEGIEEHARSHPGAYDVVTALQVLEHVSGVRPFLEAALGALRPGGHLVVAVPNNDSFVGLDRDLTLNLPPHHMGRWRRGSLEALAPIFDLDILAIETEPLQPQNLGWYQSLMERRHLPQARWKRALYYRLGFHKVFRSILEEARETVAGHTILAVFRKR